MLWEEITDMGREVSGRDLLGQMGVLSNRAGEKCVGNKENLRVVQGERTEGNEYLGM